MQISDEPLPDIVFHDLPLALDEESISSLFLHVNCRANWLWSFTVSYFPASHNRPAGRSFPFGFSRFLMHSRKSWWRYLWRFMCQHTQFPAQLNTSLSALKSLIFCQKKKKIGCQLKVKNLPLSTSDFNINISVSQSKSALIAVRLLTRLIR